MKNKGGILFGIVFAFLALLLFSLTFVSGVTFKNVMISKPTNSSVTILVKTNESSNVTIDYGLTLSYGNSVSSENESIHKVLISNLESGSTYYYNLTAYSDSGANTFNSTFKTAFYNNSPFNFSVFGDTQAGIAYMPPIFSQIYNLNPSFVLSVGDNVAINGCANVSACADGWQTQFFNYVQYLTNNTPFFLTLGNHDVDPGTDPTYEAYSQEISAFTSDSGGDKYYSFDYGDAHFVIFDDISYYPDYFNSTELDWLNDDLKSTNKTWKFVSLHHPVVGGTAPWNTIGERLHPIFVNNGVVAVFSGDYHAYNRYVKDGVNYIWLPAVVPYGSSNYTNPEGDVGTLPNAIGYFLGFVNVLLNDTSLDVTCYDNSSNIIQNFVITGALEDSNNFSITTIGINSSTSSNLTNRHNSSHLILSDSSLVSYFPFDTIHNSTNLSEDYSGGTLDGEINSGAWGGSSGYIYGGYNFSHAYDDMEILGSTSGSLNFTSNYSISLWVKPGIPRRIIGVGAATHFCFLFEGGIASCVGYGAHGRLGNNDAFALTRYSLVPVFGDYNFSSIHIGGASSFGILSNGTLLSWGHNTYGQLGIGSVTSKPSPVVVSGDYNFSTISAGGYSVCGILVNGSALCWGANTNGQLGNGSAGGISSVPIAVSGNYNFSSISLAGGSHVCGILVNGSALCWGANTNGQLGNGSAGGISSVPIAVSGNYNFSSISTGSLHTCGILTNGSALCWGLNNYGQIGDNSKTQRTSPVFVYGNYNLSSLSTGTYHNCGIIANGTLLCWGSNTYGELGNGSTGGYALIPSPIFGEYNFSIISSGPFDNCGILTNGSALCWGIGPFGNGGTGTSNTPTDILIGTLVGKNSNSYSINYDANNFLYGFTSLAGVKSNQTMDVDEWNHIVLAYNGTDELLYLNNALVGVSNATISSGYSENVFAGQFFNGSIDEIMFFNKSLTSEDVSNIYNNNYSRFVSSGEMFFDPLDFLVGNNLNISVSSCQMLSNSYVQGKIGNLSYNNFTGCGTNTSMTSGDWIESNYTIRLFSDSRGFYTPLLVGDITFDSYYVYDSTSPNITIISPTETTYNSSTILFNISATDDFEIGSCWYSMDRGEINNTLANYGGTTYYNGTGSVSSGSYTVEFWCNDSSGNLGYSYLQFSISILTNPDADSSTTSSQLGSNFELGIFRPTEKILANGYSVNIKENQKVVIPLDSGNKDVLISSIDPNNEVTMTVDGQEYLIESSGNITKIDLNDDGFYDVEILCRGVSGNYVGLTFTLIHEEMPAKQEEDQSGNVIEGSPDNNDISFWKKICGFFSKVWDWINFWN